jgi:hypothetical protein
MNFTYGLATGVIVSVIFYILFVKGFFRTSSVIKVVFPDGSWFKGIRKSSYISQETPGTHHLMVTEECSNEFKELIGKRLAVVINNVKYFDIEKY